MKEFDQQVTLYNRWTENGLERWQRTLLDNAAVVDRQGEAVRHGGAASSSARRIGPVSVGELAAIIPMAGREGYLPPAAWQAAPQKQGVWTLRPGDLLLPGNCPEEIAESPAELLPYCGRLLVISTVTAMEQDAMLRHWEVTAR